jgi:hypothetical protein
MDREALFFLFLFLFLFPFLFSFLFYGVIAAKNGVSVTITLVSAAIPPVYVTVMSFFATETILFLPEKKDIFHRKRVKLHPM